MKGLNKHHPIPPKDSKVNKKNQNMNIPPPSQSTLMESLEEKGGALPKSERPSGSERPVFIGKHKLAASISSLQSQITLIQDELEKLETIGESSLVCKEILMSVESVPDPLIPETRGPADAGWDRWFRSDRHPRRHKQWI